VCEPCSIAPSIMLAGRDTVRTRCASAHVKPLMAHWQTAGLLTFTVYCLAMHPEVLARLREEIVGNVGTGRAPTIEDVRGMKYLRAVLNECVSSLVRFARMHVTLGCIEHSGYSPVCLSTIGSPWPLPSSMATRVKSYTCRRTRGTWGSS
jgi:Cytochrome P450